MKDVKMGWKLLIVQSRKIFGTLISVHLMIFSFCSSALAMETLPPDNAKYKTIKTVYDTIARAFGDGRMAPKLVVRPTTARSGEQIACFHPGTEGSLSSEQRLEESYISIDEKVYDLLASLGPDLENGLAVLIAHELTHYYHRHGWVNEFGNAFAGTKMGAEMIKTANYEEVVKYETEADYYGGFYGYVAGYNTLGLAPKVIDLVYTEYSLPDKLNNYPSRTERKTIATKSEESLRKMVPLFEAANRLMLVKKYEEAARLFDYIACTFTSREIYNNAGVARALEALTLFKAGKVRFAYPFEFDAQTRLRGTQMVSRGYGVDVEEKRQALLQKADEDFDNAINRDKNYVAAYVNKAAVLDLLGKHGMAKELASEALEMAKKQDDRVTIANALTIRAIAYANNNEDDKALADFEASKTGTPILAALNIAAIQGPEKAIGYASPSKKQGEIISLKKENIGGVTIDNKNAMDSPDTVNLILNKGVTKDEPEMHIFSRETETWSGIIVDTTGTTLFVLTTPAGYTGQSGRGIKLGSRLSEVREKYGEPARTVPSRQGNCYVYEKAEIIFTVRPDDTVGGWMIFAFGE